MEIRKQILFSLSFLFSPPPCPPPLSWQYPAQYISPENRIGTRECSILLFSSSTGKQIVKLAQSRYEYTANRW